MNPEPIVMVVEDDDDLRDLEAELLVRAGYRVTTAREGREALDKVAQHMPSVIFLDMRMPGMDGWAFAREFRARHDHLAAIVVVTAAESAQESADEVAADGVLGKPFEIGDLIETAELYLRARSPDPHVTGSG
jgi:CheY-like chemotaxis protein